MAAANLALALLFPPHDYLSLQRGNIATFDGFYFAPATHTNRVLNTDFLALEIIVILINACIAWLLMRGRPVAKRSGGNRYQRGVLWLLFKDRRREQMSAAEVRALAQKLRQTQSP
ncbi:MAG: hypothetical protein A2045_03030 [Rhodocyclales bacterium GWA2_65_20]|nr:MAG: hypothetical protein A2045_03030 [Rhodocyclales bacterium GWA2_65_20]